MLASADFLMLQRPKAGLAAARMDTRALSVVMIPAWGKGKGGGEQGEKEGEREGELEGEENGREGRGDGGG